MSRPGGEVAQPWMVAAGAMILLLVSTLLWPAPAQALGVAEALLLGIVEGATEYLPVSSTGHLLLTQRLLEIGGVQPGTRDAADAYAIVIQAGAILAVLGLYRGRVLGMLRGIMGQDAAGGRLLLWLIIAFLPAAVAGLLAEKWIKARLFGLWPVTIAWLIGGLAILGTERRRTAALGSGVPIEALGAHRALLIGLVQCLAMWPGVSRSLATILGGVLFGASLPAAVEFSFLLGGVTLGAATAWEMLHKGRAILEAFGWGAPMIGFAAAFVSAWLAIGWMIGWLQVRGLALFGWYRIALAMITALLLGIGALPAG